MDYSFLQCGEGALTVHLGDGIDPAINRRVTALQGAIGSAGLRGITDLIPAYADLTVCYDCTVISAKALQRQLRRLLDSLSVAGQDRRRVFQLPVCYGGDYGPDLDFVCHHSGLSAQEVIELHSAPDYLIYMLGFLPGWTAHAPVFLRAVWESAVRKPGCTRWLLPAAGSCWGAHRCLYLTGSGRSRSCTGQGIWCILCPSRLPSMKKSLGQWQRALIRYKWRSAGMRLMIDAPGALTTVQDLGRTGVAHLGFCTCGAMDLTSMQIANRLVGNCRGCAVLEMTLTGISARFVGEGYFALAGGDFAPTLNGKPIENYRAYEVRSGDRLQLGAARTGLRCYLALSGGMDVPVVLGSRSTDLKIQMGGLDGRALQAGDVLTTGDFCLPIGDPTPWHIPPVTFAPPFTLRCIDGPQAARFDPAARKDFYSKPYIVTPKSDRMGLRLEGSALTADGGVDICSDGIVRGSVQVPGSGQPIVLMSDHQTVGGYAKIATVIGCDVSLLAQARPGDAVRFVPITVQEAEKIARQQEKWLDNLLFW